jgi:hypothetical protein
MSMSGNDNPKTPRDNVSIWWYSGVIVSYRSHFHYSFLFIGSEVETRRFQAIWFTWIQRVQGPHRLSSFQELCHGGQRAGMRAGVEHALASCRRRVVAPPLEPLEQRATLHLERGLHSLPRGVRLVTWTMLAVINTPVSVYRFSQNLSLKISFNGSNLTVKHFTHHMGIYSGSICRNWCIECVLTAK